MKKLLYTFLAVSIIFSACEKDEESTNNNSCQLLESVLDKTWTAEGSEWVDDGDTFVFNSDGTVTCSNCTFLTFDVGNPNCNSNSYTFNDEDLGPLVLTFSSITNTSCVLSSPVNSITLSHTP